MKKEVVDKKAREAIMQVANQLYGNQISIKQLADFLFIKEPLKRKKK